MKVIISFLCFLPLVAYPNFFENSTRRNPNGEELKSFLRAVKKGRKSGCSAFFVQNQQKRMLIGTARHCFSYNIRKACKDDTIRILPNNGSSQFVGKCKSVVIASQKDDFSIIEIEIFNKENNARPSPILEKKIKKEFKFLTLTGHIPPVYNRLKLLGHPGDKFRESKATTSHNCWVLPNDAKSPWLSLDKKQKQAWNEEKKKNGYKSGGRSEHYSKLDLTTGKMNCSVYGGNSGGPLVLEGTDSVIGLPFAYYPYLYSPIKEKFGFKFERMSEFTKRHENILRREGIKIRKRPGKREVNFSAFENWIGRDFFNEESCRIFIDSLDKNIGTIKTINHGCEDLANEQNWVCDLYKGSGAFCSYTKRNGDFWHISLTRENELKLYSSKDKKSLKMKSL